jgi:molybdopterin converting factor small subunit
MNRVKVFLFASLKDRAAGRKFIEVDLPDGITVSALKVKLASQVPGLKEAMPTVLVAIDREYAFEETVIPPGAEVAIFPPVSGG